MKHNSKNHKRNNNLIRRSKRMAAGLLAGALVFTGCGNNTSEEPVPDQTQTDAQTTDDANTDSTEPAAADTTPEAGPTGLTPEDVPYIGITCTNHPTSLFDEKGTELVTGYYYDFTLDNDSKEAYPKLDELIEELNTSSYDSEVEAMQSIEDMSRQAQTSGWGYPFYDTSEATVSRADSKAFSYYVLHDSYQGGAHGYVYFSTENYDPVTGEKIDFRDVVKDTINFSDAAYEALLKDNSDLKEYFESCPDDKDNLIKNINDSIAGDVTLAWCLEYDGISVYYADYGMGSYAAGSRTEQIKYSDYPDLFKQEYFTYDGQTADKMLSSELYSLGTRIRNTTAKDTVKIESGDNILTVYYDSYGDSVYDEFYFDSSADKYTVAGDYPELNKRLKAINDESEKTVKNKNDSYMNTVKKEIKSALANDPDSHVDYLSYSQGITLYNARADANVFSMARSLYEDHPNDNNTRIVTGININSKTGEDISFDDVVTDIQGFEDVLYEILKKDDYTGDYADNTSTEFHKQLESKNLVSRDEFSWTLGYEGVTLYFNTMVNYAYEGMAQRENDAFVSFSEHEELFNKAYTKVPGMYAYEVPMTDQFGSSLSLDVQWDGVYHTVEIWPERDEYGMVRKISVYSEGEFTEIEDFYANNISVFAVRDGMSSNYLYIQCPSEDGFTSVRVFNIGYGGVPYEENKDEAFMARIKYTDLDDKDEKFRGYILTSPLSFHVTNIDPILGMRSTCATCSIQYSGLPRPIDNMWYYTQDDVYKITALKDIEAVIVNEAGEEQGTGAIVSGGSLMPYRVSARDEGTYNWETLSYTYDESRDLDLKASDGTIFRLHLDSENGYEYKYKDEPVQSMFDGFFVYPG